MKKSFLVLTVLFCIIILNACSTPSYAMKYGEYEISKGMYSYFKNLAYNTSVYQNDDGEIVYPEPEDVNGMSGTEYIENKTMTYCLNYFWIESKFDELGLELTEEDNELADYQTELQWSNLESGFEKSGVSKEEFNLAFSVYNVKLGKIFSELYTGDGMFAVSENEISDYIISGKYAYEFMFLTVYNSETGELISEEELKTTEEKLSEYSDRIKNGEDMLTLAEEAYNEGLYPSGVPYNLMLNDTDSNSFPPNFKENLDAMADSEMEIFISEDKMVLLRKLPIEGEIPNILSDDYTLSTILFEMKGDEFNAYISEDALANISPTLEVNENVTDSVEYILNEY